MNAHNSESLDKLSSMIRICDDLFTSQNTYCLFINLHAFSSIEIANILFSKIHNKFIKISHIS